MNDLKLPVSTFRHWLYNVWLEHKTEILQYSGQDPDYDLQWYFKKYKWWLKKIYRMER
jgi:hypothetical protein